MRQQWQVSTQIRIRREHFGGSCLDLETRQWHQLNPCGWRLLQALARGEQIERLVEQQPVRGARQVLRARLDTFCQQLHQAEVLQHPSATMPSRADAPTRAAAPRDRLRAPLLVSWNVAGPRCAGAGPPRMSIWQAKALLRQIAKLDVFAVVLTGHDTVTLPGLTMMIRLGKDLGLHMALNADGCVIGPDRARMLGASGLDVVTMNLDRAVSAIHDDEQIRIRAGARFERAVAYLLRAGVRVDWHATLGDGVPATEQGVRDLLNLAELHNVTRVHIAGPALPALTHSVPPAAARVSVYLRQLHQAGHRLVGRVPHHYATPVNEEHGPCANAPASAHIGPGGAVFPCPGLATPAHRWGDVINQPLDALWDNHTPKAPTPQQPETKKNTHLTHDLPSTAEPHDHDTDLGDPSGIEPDSTAAGGGLDDDHPRLLPGTPGCPGLDFF